jgi:hypothetical protein
MWLINNCDSEYIFISTCNASTKISLQSFSFWSKYFFFFYRDFWSKFFLLTGPLYYILADRTISLITTFQSLSNFEKINILIFGGIFSMGTKVREYSSLMTVLYL